jgi:hypothetical protein
MKMCHLVENFVRDLNQSRRIATLYDKTTKDDKTTKATLP